eukprot:scaffold13079_cov71-Cyclotella_meneghiniana.AAC.3
MVAIAGEKNRRRSLHGRDGRGSAVPAIAAAPASLVLAPQPHEASPIRGAWIRAILMAYGERGNGKQTHHHTIDCQQQQNQQVSCIILMGDFGNIMTNIKPNARSDQ